MKEKLSIFLCACTALFFGSCTDLSVNDEDALRANLPSDFNWKVYAEINKDVASSQVIFDAREKRKAFGGDTIRNCINLLKNETLAEKLYLEYAGCPRNGWNRNEKCPGIYAYNANYNKPNSDSTSWQCIFGTTINSENCWQGGWESFKDTLSTYLEKVPSTINFGPVKTMCMFIPDKADAGEVLDYLNAFKLDSILIMEDYNATGIYNGRPYKKCGSGYNCTEKKDVKPYKRGTFNDYSAYTFCFSDDEKVCKVQ